MKFQNIILSMLLTAVVLAGCASGPKGQYYSNYETPKPTKNKAQLVIYQTAFFGVQRSPSIKVDGVEKCDLSTKSFFVTEVSPSKDTFVTAGLWDSFGVSQLHLSTKAGERYYIRFKYLTPDANPGILFGAVGGAIGGAVTAPDEFEDTNPLQRIEEKVALRQLEGVQEALSCKGEHQ